MPSVNDRRAKEAIEEYIRDVHRDDIAVWRMITPGDDEGWGYSLAAWRGAARRIIRIFNRTLPLVAEIDPTSNAVDNAFRTFHQKPLGEFHQYIVDKADSLRIIARVRQFELRASGDGQ